MANASETNVGPMAPRVCVVGSVNMDLTFVVDALPRPGETVLAASLTRTPGGKGANQAVAAARAGAQVQFSGAFGDDPAAAQLRAHLRANAVGLDRTVTVPGPSGTAIIVVDASAENTVLVAPGANAHLTPVPSAVANCDVLLTQLEIPVATALDRSSLQDLAAIADVVIANEHEANDWPSPPTHFVITVGADGVFEVPAPTVTPVDTAGAGDVFAGVLAANWPRNPGSPAERLRALRRACAAGALATLVSGAGDCAPAAAAIDAALRANRHNGS
ncbi:PfkB family carbohydrate kinase [Mycobacterium tuberculosis]|uniref:PfkB family carbohydrate kinase n=1 Tax=Mycobacterium tuberculosis TaxID=1773 RepID=UPI000459B1F9|nr:PfkB family carbohydrate kinase [Mycobacterium tuberculosis]KCG03887.1 ribokinase RbsK [Mycobacterium tuberculosis KT-0039]